MTENLFQAMDQCNDSLETTIKNMALLQLASKSLDGDIKDKKQAVSLDSSVVRLRRRKKNYRWVLKGKTCPLVAPSLKHSIRSLSH